MDLPADGSTPANVLWPQPAPAGTVRQHRRRRPTGEPPPLPHHLQTSGIRWLVAMVVLVALTIAVFAGGLRGIAVEVTVVDDAVVGWLAGVDLAGFEAAMRALAALSSWWVLNIVLYGLIVALLVLRRFRHLIVLLIVAQLVSLLAEDVLAAVARRPRPFGVVIGEGWAAGPCPRSSCCSSRRRLS